MISRESAKTIADAYHAVFTSYRYSTSTRVSGSTFTLHRDSLYDFLYLHDFDGWIMNAIHGLRSDKRALLEFVMRLHTGESLASGTPDWTWDARKSLGQRFLRDLAAALLVESQKPAPSVVARNTEEIRKMQRQLELDGYVFKDGVLLVPEESILNEQAEQGVLMQLVKSLGLGDPETIAHHLRLSEEHYTSSRWDDSIANSRKVLEAVLQQAAAVHAAGQGSPLDDKTVSRPAAIRDYLETTGLLDHKEIEAIRSTYSLLSEAGGHPNIAGEDQARLMRHLALTYSQFALLRLKAGVRSRKGAS